MPRRFCALFCVLLVLGLYFAGCAEMAYRHMNDPSRDGWQKPKAVIEKLAIKPGARIRLLWHRLHRIADGVRRSAARIAVVAYRPVIRSATATPTLCGPPPGVPSRR